MRLAKRVALMPQRKSVLCSLSKHLLNFFTSLGLRWGYRNEQDVFFYLQRAHYLVVARRQYMSCLRAWTLELV